VVEGQRAEVVDASTVTTVGQGNITGTSCIAHDGAVRQEQRSRVIDAAAGAALPARGTTRRRALRDLDPIDLDGCPVVDIQHPIEEVTVDDRAFRARTDEDQVSRGDVQVSRGVRVFVRTG
jgi:hypothetical protein